MSSAPTKLDQLTSLRFFAALLIVVHHWRGLFGIRDLGFNLSQGVSFFFVLSGFILYFVYPQLPDFTAVRKFWQARVARIWPAYLAAFALAMWLTPSPWDPRTALAHLLMVHGWIPQSAFYASYNGVAWSVSIEFFFYLMFPLLVLGFERTWKLKLAIAASVIVALVAVCWFRHLPAYGNPTLPHAGYWVTRNGLLTILPVSRLLEFITGMCIALAWRRRRDLVQWSEGRATVYELLALGACAFSMYATMQLAGWGRDTYMAGATDWFVACGSFPAFAALIYVLAHGRGWLTRVLRFSWLVLLGEISYSLYLIHRILLLHYANTESVLHALPSPVAFAIVGLILLIASYLMWALIEMPFRRLLAGQRLPHGATEITKAWQPRISFKPQTLIAAGLLACVAGGVQGTAEKPRVVTLSPITVPLPKEGRKPAPLSCNIESVDASLFMTQAMPVEQTEVRVAGWFVSEHSKRSGLPATLRLRTEDATQGWETEVHTWMHRPSTKDFVKAMDDNLGFSVWLDLSALPPGRYRMSMAFEEGGKRYLCNHGRTLDLLATAK
jgi:peptidoglycan/LPS O-acetylase OafA/YrhL